MHPFANNCRRLAVLSLTLAFWSAAPNCLAELLPAGFRPLPLGVHALVGGRIFVKPGEEIDSGTIVIRDGFISAVGSNAPVPADARVWDMQGTTIYAGFIEPYWVPSSTNPPVLSSDVMPISSGGFTSRGFKYYGAPGAETDQGKPGAGYPLPKFTPEFRSVEKYSPKEKMLSPLRELGFTTAVVAPDRGILRGSSVLVALSDDDPDKAVIKPDVFQHVAFETQDTENGVYPLSLMGVIAAIRQCFSDARHYALDWADYETHRLNRRRPEFDPALEALRSVAAKKIPLMFESGSALMDDRAAQLSRELGFEFCLVSCGQEWRRPDRAKATRAAFIVSLNFPDLPKLPNETDWDQVTLDQLRAWDWAPENAALLRRQGLEIALTTYGLKDKKDFRKNLRQALDRGLSEDDALAALTTVPARLCGVSQQLGTLEPGKLADLLVVEGKSYFDPEAKVRATWIEGRVFPSPGEDPKSDSEEESRVGGTPPSMVSGTPPPKEAPEKHPAPPAVTREVKARGSTGTNVPPRSVSGEADKQTPEARNLMKLRVAHSPLEGRGPITNPPAVLIRNATVWTCGPRGVLTNAHVFILRGKIQSVGTADISIPAGALVLDARGGHLTPGLIDCHSHTAILGNVNEAGLPSTAMVRIRDVVNSETDNLYEQLAGGVTTVNLLHGSANPIGGQNCVIKLRDGESPDGLVFSNAPPGIKFALGENVKQSNWGEKFVTRFPQTRMGVRAFIQNRFLAAQEYTNQWAEYSNKMAQATQRGNIGQAGGTAAPLPPRRDLELEALGEILQGQRWIHCHAYRQDEMLMLIRLMQGFGVQIATFQHGLEGYKIADELAAAKVGVSAFSDWWGYKFEVYDAIPYNGSLMRERGVLVSFNSDSSDLARRLYSEAAKAVKYGAAPEVEALNFVTINPARQLRIEPYVGSIEVGKDADLALWSKAPLDFDTVCLQTWIEGKQYFDRALNADRAAKLNKERDALLSKAKKMAKLSGDAKSKKADGGAGLFFRVSLEHEFDGRDRHCLEP